jgi:sugar fermentation stimulation protein A
MVLCELNGQRVKAYLPNPGRLQELLLPGVLLYLEEASGSKRTLPYTAVAVEREGEIIVLHTHKTNDVVRYLIDEGVIKGLDRWCYVRREVTRGKSRFDFLYREGRQEILLEVKSCTLFSKQVAMFPDAVTVRGRRHLNELAGLSTPRLRCAVVFLIHWRHAKWFLPDYHTDLEFAKTCLAVRNKVAILPVAVRWLPDFSIDLESVAPIDIPWAVIDREAHDGGSYLVLFKVHERKTISIGKLGSIHFKAGYYIYIGSAKKGLSQRIERHVRSRKKLFWHIDYLRGVAEFHVALPVRSSDNLECEIAKKIKAFAEWEVPGFGASDCVCSSHLFGNGSDPLMDPAFHLVLQHFRMERLVDTMGKVRASSG